MKPTTWEGAATVSITKYFAKTIGWYHKPWLRFDMILSTFGLNILALVVPLLILQLYDRVIPKQGWNTLIMLCVGVFVAVTLEAILRFSRSYILIWLGEKFENKASLGAFHRVLGAVPGSHKGYGAGQHVENIEGVSVLREFLAGSGFLLLFDLPFLFLFIGIIVYFAGVLVCVPLVIITVFVICAFFLGIKLRKILSERLDIDDRRFNFIIEILSNYHTLKALGMEEQMLRRFERIHQQSSLIEYKVNYYTAEARDLGSVFSYLLFGAIIGFGALEVIDGKITPGIMGACIILSNRLMQPIQSAVGIWARLQHFRIAEKRLKGMYALPQESENKDSLIKDAIQGKIELRNASFHYEEGQDFILNNINVRFPKGSLTTIYGANGSGKTTLLKILVGHETLTSGHIFIDDIVKEEYDVRLLRSQIIYLPPKSPLFEGTILENLTLFRPELYREQALEMSYDLGLNDWIMRLPQGYETLIGDQLFTMLPGGIQQRICLIRALLMKPKILLLDEANTSLDEQGDLIFQQLLKQIHGQITIVFVTHRPSLQKLADQSFEIVKGKLVRKDNVLNLPPFLQQDTAIKKQDVLI